MKIEDRFSISNQKINIFIGSSTESKDLAYAIKGYFEEELFNVKVWDKAFKRGVSNLDNLKKFTTIYDYAIMLTTNDNVVTHRGNKYGAVPPNIVFETGLFYGRMGESRTFMIAEKSISNFIDNVFSDFKGISLGRTFENDKSKTPAENVKEAAESVRQEILEKYRSTTEISFLPSAALAIGYFENFIARVAEALYRLKTRKEGLLQLKQGKNDPINYSFPFFKREFKIKVVLPDTLLDSSHETLVGRTVDANMDNTYIQTESRPFGIFWKVQTQQEIDDNGFIFYDFPTTLYSSQKTIEMVLRSSGTVMNLDDADVEELVGEKEIYNFIKALKYQIRTSRKTYIRKSVEIVTNPEILI